MNRVVGFGLVLVSLTFLFGLTVPGLIAPWCERGLLAVSGLCGVFVGMSLLKTTGHAGSGR